MTLPASIATEIRVSDAGHETPAAIAKRLGLTETEVFAAIRGAKPKPCTRTRGETNWTETRYKRDRQPAMDVCPEHCTGPRPYKVAPGVMVCKSCMELEMSEQPIREVRG